MLSTAWQALRASCSCLQTEVAERAALFIPPSALQPACSPRETRLKIVAAFSDPCCTLPDAHLPKILRHCCATQSCLHSMQPTRHRYQLVQNKLWGAGRPSPSASRQPPSRPSTSAKTRCSRSCASPGSASSGNARCSSFPRVLQGNPQPSHRTPESLPQPLMIQPRPRPQPNPCRGLCLPAPSCTSWQLPGACRARLSSLHPCEDHIHDQHLGQHRGMCSSRGASPARSCCR